MAGSNFDLEPQEWGTLRGLLDAALDLPVAARDGWLEQLDDRHAPFKPRLCALLAHAELPEIAALLDTMPKIETDQFAPLYQADVSGASASDTRVGPYRLLRQLGEGGMATVWLAERTDVLQGRKVALKLPHGAWRRAGLADRMAREREILATLEHPNIARLYDAGVAEDGQPYLALEYVEGQRLDLYCEERNLNVRDRLALFLQVTSAVAYAHAHLVVHRDLKPSNILVTPEGQVRLLDFGIAKLLDQGVAAETEVTQQSGAAMTPDYASPEQISGEPVGTASDVYALGIVLYELLCGQRPYHLERGSRAALEAEVLRVDPRRPSEMAVDARRRGQLRGDLDTIVLKVLKKKPADRYATVNALADDIERHLAGLPVLARPDSWGYRAHKFIARNRLAVSAAAAVCIAMLVGATVAWVESLEATRQRDVAMQQQKRAASYSDFLSVLLQDSGGGDAKLTPTQMLDRGVAMLEHQSGQDESVAAYMWYELSRNYMLFVQPERELALLDRSSAIARHIGDNNLIAASECSAAWALSFRDRVAAEARLKTGLDALAVVAAPATFARLDCLRAQGAVLRANGEMTRAVERLEQGRDQLVREGVATDGWRFDMMTTQLEEGYRATDRFKDALALAETSLRHLRNAGRQGSLAELVALGNYGGTLCRLGEYVACYQTQSETLAWIEQQDLAGVELQGIRYNAAFTLMQLNQPRRAMELALADLTLAEHSGNTVLEALCHLVVARALAALGQPAESLRRLDKIERMAAADPKLFARTLNDVATLRAQIKLEQRDVAGAQSAVQILLEHAEYPDSMRFPGLDRLLRLAARVELEAGNAGAAERLATDALQISLKVARTPTSSGDVGLAELLRAEARARLGRDQEAAADATGALEALNNGLGRDHPETLRTQALLRDIPHGAQRSR